MAEGRLGRANTPINLTDPTGEVAPLVAGLIIVGAGAWSATVAELFEAYKGSSPGEVARAGIRAGTGGAAAAAVTVYLPASAPVAATVGGAVGGFVESAIEQVQTGVFSAADLVVSTGTGALFGRLGEAIIPTGTTRQVGRQLLAKVKDLRTLEVQKVPFRVSQWVSTLDDRLRSAIPQSIVAGLLQAPFRLGLLGGRK